MSRGAAWVALVGFGVAACAHGWKPTPAPTLLEEVTDSEGEAPWPTALRLVPDDAEIVRGFVVEDFAGLDQLRPFVVRAIEHEILKASEECPGGEIRMFVTASAGDDRSLTVVVREDLAASVEAKACLVEKASKLSDAEVLDAGSAIVLVTSAWRSSVEQKAQAPAAASLAAPLPQWASLWMVLLPSQVETQGPFAHVDRARVVLDLRENPRFELELHTTSGKTKAVHRTWKRTPLAQSLLVGIPSMTFIDHELARGDQTVTLVGRGLR